MDRCIECNKDLSTVDIIYVRQTTGKMVCGVDCAITHMKRFYHSTITEKAIPLLFEEVTPQDIGIIGGLME